MFRLAVLISGTGSTLRAILEDSRKDRVYEVGLVIADREAPGLQHAKEYGVPYKVFPRGKDLSGKILPEVEGFDLVVLAGFLSILEGELLTRLQGKMINLHPSLLPRFGGKGMYGHKVHEAVLASGMPYSGCTVHYVTETVDGGSLILQRIIGIQDATTAEDIAKRVMAEEKGALIDAIRMIAREESET